MAVLVGYGCVVLAMWWGCTGFMVWFRWICVDGVYTYFNDHLRPNYQK
jgi:hypothetical protein